MADESTSMVNTNQGTPPQDGNTEPQGGEEKFDAEYVRALRKEAAQYRTRLKELETRQQAEDNAKLTEQEKLQKRLKELEQQTESQTKALRTRTTEYEVKLAAAQMGIVDPEAAWKLLDASSLEFDAEGKPKDIEKALRELVKVKTYLVGQRSAPNAGAGAGGTGGNPKTTMNDAIRRAAGRQ